MVLIAGLFAKARTFKLLLSRICKRSAIHRAFFMKLISMKPLFAASKDFKMNFAPPI